MIPVEWKDPNFRFNAKENGGRCRTVRAICYAKSKDDLIRSLTKRDLIVTASDIEDYNFMEWEKRADEATQDAIAQYNRGRRPIKFRKAIWDELKFHLFELFNGKCAYCESKVQHIDFGDVDHYRPKGKVFEDPSSDVDSGHPGYYWLAYNKFNLLPACGLCNKPPGKATHFPVLGAHSRDSSTLPNEEPLLLNPYISNISPLQHLEFNDKGAAIPRNKSKHGETSELFFRLNRPGIGERRRDAIIKVQGDWSAFASLYSSFYKEGEVEEQRSRYRADVAMGHREYSAAQLCELDRITERGRI